MLIVDTGVVLGAADRADPDHRPCAELVNANAGELFTTPLVIAEASYLIGRQLGYEAEAVFFQSVAAAEIHVEMLSGEDNHRIADLIRTYGDLPLGGTDASVVVLAERLGHTRIATLDRRHFAVVRPMHVEAFDLLP